jgi:hypothetical protein
VVRCGKIWFDGSAVTHLGINGGSVVEGTGTGGLLFIGEKRGRIAYATGSLSLTDLVEFELDFSFGYFYKKNPKINVVVANFWI